MEAIPGWGAHHGESADLLSGGTCKRDKKKTLLGWDKEELVYTWLFMLDLAERVFYAAVAHDKCHGQKVCVCVCFVTDSSCSFETVPT